MNKDKNTWKLLLLISSHLSGRQKAMNQEYELNIYKDGTYSFHPNLVVYPDKLHRAQCYQSNIIHHILKYDFEEVCIVSNSEVLLDTTKIVPGQYRYIYVTGRTHRKWVKC